MFKRLLNLSPDAEWQANVQVYSLSSAEARQGLATRGGNNPLNMKAKLWYRQSGRCYQSMQVAIADNAQELAVFKRRASDLLKSAKGWKGHV